MTIRKKIEAKAREARCSDEGCERALERARLGRMDPWEWAEACFGTAPRVELVGECLIER